MNETKETILTPVESFISEQLRTYAEPVRGEGFSRVKYEAALWSGLKAATQKEIAKELGLRYDVLRQWHSQEDFIRAVDTVLQEFGMWVAGKLREASKENTVVRFNDVDQWGELAARTIGLALERRGLKLINASAVKEIAASLPHWRYPRTRAVRDMILFEHDKRDARNVWHDLIQELEPREREHEYRLVVNVLRNPKATSEQRREALRVFEAIARRGNQAKVQVE